MNYLNRTENGQLWDFKGKLDFVDEWFMMSSPVPLIAITVSYLLFVLKIGPEYMKSRSPFILNNVIVLYNIIQVIASSYMFYLTSLLMLPNGFVSKTCLLEKEETRDSLATIMYYYFLAKLSELLDTVFFILRKKDNQVTFLHVYHHTIMLILSWTILKYEPTYPTIFIRNINSFVHIIMYTYYGLSSFPNLAKYLWWKKYITSMQLVQFTLILIHFVMTYTTSECSPSYILSFVITINASLFLFLFGKFYLKTYLKKGEKTGGKSDENEMKLDKDEVKTDDEIRRIVNSHRKSDATSTDNESNFVHRKRLMTKSR